MIRTYEDEIRKAREARDFGIAEEERKISASRSGLEDVERVRDFFSLSGAPTGRGGRRRLLDDDDLPPGEETQVMEPADEDDTQILRRPGPLSDDYFETGENRDR